MDESKLTPMMQQYFRIKKEYGDYILFYRLGDFYEMFFDDAVTAARVLEIALTGRNCGLEERAPLCGIPHHSAAGYIEKLVKSGYKVAICEQTEDPASAKGLVRREVVRVVTPGTVIDPDMLESSENNYVLSLCLTGESTLSISYADVTTGEFKSFITHSLSKAIDEVNKISPGEIIIPDSLGKSDPQLMDQLSQFPVTFLEDRIFRKENAVAALKRGYNVFAVSALGIDEGSDVICSAGSLIWYIQETQRVSLSHFKTVFVYSVDDFMIIDKFTRKNLEITETMRSLEKKGSLLWVLDNTSTSMGSRHLKQMVLQPLLRREAIERRLSSVEELYDDMMTREELRTLLSSVYDVERISSKLVFGNVNPRDLIALKSSLSVIPDIKRIMCDLKSEEMACLNVKMDPLTDVWETIDSAIKEDAPITLKDGGVIREDYNDELRDVNFALTNGKDWLIDIEQREKEATGIKALKIGFNKVFGYYIEISKGSAGQAPESYIRKQTLSNCERFITEDLKVVEEKILGAQDKKVILEQAIFNEVKESILGQLDRLLETSKALAYLDCLISLSTAAEKFDFVRPSINDGGMISIKDGRHPVVERISGHGTFVPNDSLLDSDENLIHIITGPNMAGKSTYLRQVALIVLMAQIGAFVPASHADISVVDRIFTRVGASDDLSSGQSTFMVEMNELANILNNATSRSLIILDEIGRGTSTYDGLSIAWATVEYLSNESGEKPKTMFATHYHELTELEGIFDGVKNFRVAVEENGQDIVFLRKIARGGSGRSYGIEVAKLAGLPDKVIQMAKRVLKRLEENDINRNIQNILDTSGDSGKAGVITPSPGLREELPEQLNFFNSDGCMSEILDTLRTVEVFEITPLDAMKILSDLASKAKQI